MQGVLANADAIAAVVEGMNAHPQNVDVQVRWRPASSYGCSPFSLSRPSHSPRQPHAARRRWWGALRCAIWRSAKPTRWCAPLPAPSRRCCRHGLLRTFGRSLQAARSRSFCSGPQARVWNPPRPAQALRVHGNSASVQEVGCNALAAIAKNQPDIQRWALQAGGGTPAWDGRAAGGVAAASSHFRPCAAGGGAGGVQSGGHDALPAPRGRAARGPGRDEQLREGSQHAHLRPGWRRPVGANAEPAEQRLLPARLGGRRQQRLARPA